MWPFAQLYGSSNRQGKRDENGENKVKIHLAKDLVVRSDLFIHLPPAIFMGDIPEKVKDEYLTHGGSIVLPSRLGITHDDPGRSIFGVHITRLPVREPCILFTAPQDRNLVIDKRDFPLVKYSYEWICDSTTAKRLCDMRKYVVHYPSPTSASPRNLPFLSCNSIGTLKRKHHDTPIKAFGHRYERVAKQIRVEQELESRKSRNLHPRLGSDAPIFYIGDAIIALSALQHSLPAVEVVQGRRWRLVRPDPFDLPSPPYSSSASARLGKPRKLIAVLAPLPQMTLSERDIKKELPATST